MATNNVSLPRYGEPPFDPSGNWSRSWYRFFEALSQVVGGGSVPDLSSIIAAIADLRGQIQEQAIVPSDIGAQLALTRLQGLEEWVMGLSQGPDLSQYVLLQTLQNTLAAYALLDSPAFVNTPTAPTAAVATNTTQLATTAFVQARFASPPTIGATTPGAGAFTTLSASGAITPHQTIGIVGTTTNNDAQAGSMGEAFDLTVTGVAITSSVVTNIMSQALSAGDWDVTGHIFYNAAATTIVSTVLAGISTASATVPANPYKAVNAYTGLTGQPQSVVAPMRRIKLAAPATVYLIGYVTYGSGALTADASLHIRRPR